MDVWNIEQVEKDLRICFEENSEVKLLHLLKNNTFLFYEIYDRKYGVQPIFHEVSFGGELRCDFAWLNDNSDGPEWVLVEVEKPKMRLFNKNLKPSSELYNAIEQVNQWDKYFSDFPTAKSNIFGAVAKFRYILIAGTGEAWHNENSMKWRSHYHLNNKIEIRSSDVFLRALKNLHKSPNEFWSFKEQPKTYNHTKLKEYWQGYRYMDNMRKLFR